MVNGQVVVQGKVVPTKYTYVSQLQQFKWKLIIFGTNQKIDLNIS